MSSSLVSEIKTASNKTDRSGTRRTGGTSNSFGVNTELFDSGEVDDFKHEEELARPSTSRRRVKMPELVDSEFDGDFRRLIEEAEESTDDRMLSTAGKIDMSELFEDPDVRSALNLLMCLRALEHDCGCHHGQQEFCEICCMKISPAMIGVVENDHQGGQVMIHISDEAACSEEIGFITRGQLNWLRGQYTQGKKAVLQGRN